MLKDPRDLRSRLRRLADVVADEAERNQKFAAELAAALESTAVSEAAPSRGERPHTAGDPFPVFESGGDAGLQAWLANLDIPSLKAIVREHRLDTSRLSDKWKTRERFVHLIRERVAARLKQGDSFRNYASRGALPPSDAAEAPPTPDQ